MTAFGDAPPLIGLTAYRELASWGVWHDTADLLPAAYAAEITVAGGVPLLLPTVARNIEVAADAAVAAVHGLVLSGGPDVDPVRYGAVRDPQTGPPRPERDAWETALAEAAMRRRVPLLGVCRGMQVLAAALGGSLVQHLPDVVGTELHCPTPGKHGHHRVRIASGSRLGDLLGGSTLVASYHHQAVDRLPASATATAWADDGTIEAFEVAGPGWVTAVQWHPEAHDGAALFSGFIAACASARDLRQAGASR